MNNNENFFPTTDYKIPETSNYLKITEGEHTFRVLSSAIVGYSYFNNENKPIRSKTPFEEMPTDMKKDGRMNHFWAFVVWNYESKRVQILELTQKTIMTPMQALIKNPKWGNPKNYDITITRKGTSMQDTEYAVMPNPHAPVDNAIVEAYKRSAVSLEALYEGIDPFTANKNG
jgi:hypothetical protein